jgi:methylated-DNA-[protein]-cysteine S-methyltransferase
VIHSTVLDTPIGPLSLLTTDDHLVAMGFTPEPAQMYARLHPTLRERPLTTGPHPAGHSALRRAETAMTAYFDGDLDALDDLAVRQPANEGRERLWTALRAVPAGSTVTYADLAVKAGMRRTAARAAGGACAANLVAPVVPCHRVVPAGGGLGGYYYGVDRKDWLLKHESR